MLAKDETKPGAGFAPASESKVAGNTGNKLDSCNAWDESEEKRASLFFEHKHGGPNMSTEDDTKLSAGPAPTPESEAVGTTINKSDTGSTQNKGKEDKDAHLVESLYNNF